MKRQEMIDRLEQTSTWDVVVVGGGATGVGIAVDAASRGYQVADLLDAVHRDSGIELSEMRVDGGASTNDTLMQFQADVLGVPVVRPKVHETTALGAAYLAGLAVGYWKGNDDVRALTDINAREFTVMAVLALAVLFMGVYPKPFTDVMDASVAELLRHVAVSKLPN